METKDTPQGVVGFRFAHALLSGDHLSAHALLSAELKHEYPESRLREEFESMMTLANPVEEAGLPDIAVMDNHDASVDAKGWVYVSVWTEAVTITAKPFGDEYLITELIWGRP
jgi:hypothetical protein